MSERWVVRESVANDGAIVVEVVWQDPERPFAPGPPGEVRRSWRLRPPWRRHDTVRKRAALLAARLNAAISEARDRSRHPATFEEEESP